MSSYSSGWAERCVKRQYNNIRRILILGVIAIFFGVSALIAREIKPGVERWAIKTSATRAGSVKTVSLNDILQLTNPPGSRKNNPTYQKHDLI